jgi:phage terminase large subunit-like protein
VNCSKAEWLGSLPEEQRLAFQAEMTPSQLEELNWDWEFWARPNQLIPKGDWLTWLLLAGRGFGKTRSAAEAVRALVCGATPLTAGKHARIALVAETAADARDVMVEGESGLLAVHPQEFRPLYEPSKRRLTWPNGALATLYNAVEPDQLRGPQHSLAWCDELAKWRYAQETWDMLQFGLRLGARPQAIIATTPRPIPVLKQIIRQPGTVITRGTTFENRSNLAESFLSQCLPVRGNAAWSARAVRRDPRRYPGRSLDPGSYRWTRAPRELPQMSRVVVAIDPSGTRGPGRASAPDGRRGKRSCFNRDAWRVLPPIATACAGYPGKPQDHAAAAQRLRSVARWQACGGAGLKGFHVTVTPALSR